MAIFMAMSAFERDLLVIEILYIRPFSLIASRSPISKSTSTQSQAHEYCSFIFALSMYFPSVFPIASNDYEFQQMKGKMREPYPNLDG